MPTNSTAFIKTLLILFLTVSGLYYAREFLIPLSIGAVLATLFLPFCKWLELKKVPRALAAFICLMILLLFIAGIGALIGWQISSLINDIALIQQKAITTADRIQQYIFNHFGISISQQTQLIKDQQNSITSAIELMAGSVMHVLTGLLLTLVYVFLLLYYRVHIKNFLLLLSPDEQRDAMKDVIYGAAHVSQQYLVGMAKMIACLWVMYGIGFSSLGVKNAIFFAVLCGLMEIVPFIGNITGTSITVLVAAVHGAGLPLLGGIVITYGIVQFIQGWVLEPLILGPQVKINPLFTILALILGELVWGIPGIILAIPLTAMFKIVCDHIDSLKPFGFLIGEIETANTEPGFIRKIRKWFNSRKSQPTPPAA